MTLFYSGVGISISQAPRGTTNPIAYTDDNPLGGLQSGGMVTDGGGRYIGKRLLQSDRTGELAQHGTGAHEQT